MTRGIPLARFGWVASPLFIFYVGTILSAFPLYGQATSGDLVGIVADSSGAGIANASLQATNEATGIAISVRANSRGEYRFNNLPVGLYTLEALAADFSPVTVRAVDIQLNKTATTNVNLPLAQVSTSVEVSEAPAVIDTTTSQVQNAFRARDARELPQASLTSGVLNLSLLGAGVSSSGGLGSGTGPSIGGQRPTNNNFNVEGVDNNDKAGTGPVVSVPNEAVDEFSVLQNQFSPEFGFSSGGIFNTNIRTGTNQIHGSIYEYFQNRNLDAVDQINARQGFSGNPRYDNNRVGANLGGPVLRNKLFYFADFEYNPIGQNSPPVGQILAPTAGGYSTLAGLPGMSQTNLSTLQKYVGPAPSATRTILVGQDPNAPGSVGTNIPIGPISISSPNYSNQYNLVTAGDWNARDSDQLRLRYIYNRYSGIDTRASLPVFFSPIPNNVHLASLSEFHNFSPSFSNELRLAYNRRFNNYTFPDAAFPGLDVFPNIVIADLNLQLGPDPNSPQGYIQNTYQIADNATKLWGKHTLKFGYDFHDIIASNTFVQRARGDYRYTQLNRYLLDLVPDQLGQRSVGAAGGIPVGFLQNALFLNDEFRIRTNLSVSLGIRYEYVTVPIVSRAQKLNSLADAPGVIVFQEPKSTTNDWAPRIGIAYSPGTSGRTSIRAGFGMSYDEMYNNLGINAKPPFYQQTMDVNIHSNDPNFLASGGIPGTLPPPPTTPAAARAQTTSYNFDQIRPYSINWTLGIQHVFAKDYTAEVRYVGTRGVHLQVQEELNRVAIVTATQNLPTFLTTPSSGVLAGLAMTLGDLQSQPNNPWDSLGFRGLVLSYAPWGNSSYHGLAAQLTRRFSRDFSFIAAYTLSHNIDDSTATVFSTSLTPRRPQDFQNLRADKASSMLDRRHRLTLTPNYDLPFLKGSNNWFLKNVVGNWNIAGTYTYESPEYATVQSGTDANLNGDTAGDRFITNPAGAANLSSDVYGVDRNGNRLVAGNLNIVAYIAVNQGARYVKAATGAYANGGRNTLPLNPINNIDLALAKRINLSERIRFQVGGQFYNLLNHAQYIPGFLNDIRPRGFTTPPNFLTPGSLDFGAFDRFFPSNSRQIQVVAKLIF